MGQFKIAAKPSIWIVSVFNVKKRGLAERENG